MSITIRCNTSPTATTLLFFVRPPTTMERSELMRPVAEALAEALRLELHETVIVETFEDEFYVNCFDGEDLPRKALYAAVGWLNENVPTQVEPAMLLSNVSDENLALLGRLTKLSITDPGVAIAASHEIVVVAQDVVPAMMEYELAVHAVAPNGSFAPQVRGVPIPDKLGGADPWTWCGHNILLPMIDSFVASSIAHEVAHVMCDVTHLCSIGHEERWARSYDDLLTRLVCCGTEGRLMDLVAGRDGLPSGVARKRPAIRISKPSEGFDFQLAYARQKGEHDFRVLESLIETSPDHLPRHPIVCDQGCQPL